MEGGACAKIKRFDRLASRDRQRLGQLLTLGRCHKLLTRHARGDRHASRKLLVESIIRTQARVVIDNLVGRVAEQFGANDRKQCTDNRQTNHQHQLPTKGAQIPQ